MELLRDIYEVSGSGVWKMMHQWYTMYAPSAGVKWPYIPWQIFVHAAETWAKAYLIFTQCKLSAGGINDDV